MTWLAKLGSHFSKLGRRLLDLQDTPRALAGGVAIGIFFGFTPLFGLKTLLCLGTATVLRFNPLAAVIAVCLHDVLTPLWPILLRLEYDIGHWLLSHPHTLPEKFSTSSLHPTALLHWTFFFDVGLPMLVGSLVFAIPAAIASYGIFFAWARHRLNRRQALSTEDSAPPHRAGD